MSLDLGCNGWVGMTKILTDLKKSSHFHRGQHPRLWLQEMSQTDKTAQRNRGLSQTRWSSLAIGEAIADPHFQTHMKILNITTKAGLREKGFFENRIAYTTILEIC